MQQADNPPTSCRLDRFSSNIQRFVSAEITHNKDDELFLKLRLSDANDRGNVNDLCFADRFSRKRKWIAKSALGVGVVRRTVVSRPEAEQELKAIENTIEHAKALASAM